MFTRPWRLDPEKHRIAEEEFLTLEKAGIIRRSNSLWASPLHLVPKKDGLWRPCGNYRRLIAVTIPDSYPLPNMQSLNDRMAGHTVFSKIDLVKAYHQIPIAEGGHSEDGLPGTLHPTSNQQNRAGNHFPLAHRQGFLHVPPPFSTMTPLGPPATTEHRPD